MADHSDEPPHKRAKLRDEVNSSIDLMFDLESHLPDELMGDNTWGDALSGVGNKPPGPGPGGPQMNGGGPGDDPGGTSAAMVNQMALRQQQLHQQQQQQQMHHIMQQQGNKGMVAGQQQQILGMGKSPNMLPMQQQQGMPPNNVVVGPMGGGGPGGMLGMNSIAQNNGSHDLPWIHVDDLCGMIKFAIEKPEVKGVLNGVAPQLITNKDFTKAFASALFRPAFFPLPEFVLNLIFGKERAVLLTKGAKVVPKRVQELGYQYRYPDIQSACKDVARLFPPK